MSRTRRYQKPDVWIARTHYRKDDSTRVKAQSRSAAKEFNASGTIDTEPQDWERIVGEWID